MFPGDGKALLAAACDETADLVIFQVLLDQFVRTNNLSVTQYRSMIS